MYDDIVSSHLSRRSLLRLGLSGAALTAGGGLLAGCSSSGDSRGVVPASERVPLPAYVPFEGARPDLKGEKGSADGFLHYPQNPPKSVDGRPGDGAPITAMLAIFYPAWPAASENAAWSYLNEQLGSELQIQQVPSPDYVARFATTIAGNDLPAVMQVGKVARLPELMKAKFVDLTKYLSGDAVKKYPNLANIPSEAWPAGVFNNAIYGIPTTRGMWQSSVLFNRSDLIKAKGLDAGQIASFDDLFSLCKELTDSKNSVWALATPPIGYIRQMLKMPNVWRLDGGKLTNAYEVPEQEEVLNACIKLWKAGVVHPDAFALNSEQTRQFFIGGRTLICGGNYQAWSRFHREHKPGTSFDLDALPLPGYSGGQGTFHLAEPAYSVGGISKGNEDRVETILKVWNYLAAPFGSAEYLAAIYGQSGPDYTLNGSDPVQTARGLREQLLLTPLVAAPGVAYYPNDSQVTEKTHAHMKKMANTNAIQNPALYQYSETASAKGGELNKRMDSDFNDIIQGRKKISDWAKSVASWRSGGGDRIRTELEAAMSAK
ncbi:extracellular solute-binding protein [Kribbella pittospori]|uniref:Extracellular solute-binding protein n=1 Tax=Kribbella pittospori TaxID=722689 RepID=A0A4R0JYV7_9ACTN|nr:extracellular solute-binding protein [Kribbella pittospori]TCC51474.1 extracellular solute-binding protein [Kribbella pittospori]